MKERGSVVARTFRYLYLRFLRLRGTEEEVARGMALGVFIGMTPTMGVQMPLALFFAMLLRENKIAALFGVWVSNPMTAVPIYTFNFKVGKDILGTESHQAPGFSSLNDLIALGHDLLLPLIVGSLVVGIASYFVSYFLTIYAYRFVKMEKEKISQIRERKKAARKKEQNLEE